jgi:predicted nuclease of restriction endonuclease-like (RecB) superfamily
MKQDSIIKNSDFRQWVGDLKKRIRQSQIKAAIKVNSELLHLYWDLGHDITVRQLDAVWGSGFYRLLSKELMAEFPDMQGFSVTNLNYCKRFYLLYSQLSEISRQLADEIYPQVGGELQIAENADNTIYPQVGGELQIAENVDNTIRPQVGDELEIADNIIYPKVRGELEKLQILLIPWGHQKLLIDKCKSATEALFYVQKTIKNGWSRAVLMNFIDAGLYGSQGKAVNNFSRLLPDAQSELAQETLKDPYNFDFLTLTQGYKEKELEDALTENITKFLLELGQGFAYVGRQVPVQIGNKERRIDLLFYHLELRCYVVIELKAREFEAEHTGKLGLYISAINHQRKKETDNPTIGLIICKNKDNIEAQYSLESSSQPIGISEYELSKLLPDNFKSSLPSIEEIERELNKRNK